MANDFSVAANMGIVEYNRFIGVVRNMHRAFTFHFSAFMFTTINRVACFYVEVLNNRTHKRARTAHKGIVIITNKTMINDTFVWLMRNVGLTPSTCL